MKDIICIDVSGKDILDPHFSICVVLNDKHRYGYRFEQIIQDKLKSGYNSGAYNLKQKKNYINLKIRLYSAIVCLLLEYILSSQNISLDCIIFMCNDFDGHFNDIRQFLLSNLSQPWLTGNIRLHRHSKSSVIQLTAKALSKGVKAGIILPEISLKSIIKLIIK